MNCAILILRITLLSLVLTMTTASQCYFPDGILAKHDRPCYTDGSVSHCCSPNSVCLTNSLCLAVQLPYTLSRGSGTDEVWGSGCPSICETLQPSTGALLSHFNGTGIDATYCCGPLVSRNNSLTCNPINGQKQDPFQIAQGILVPGTAALVNFEQTNSTLKSINGTMDSMGSSFVSRSTLTAVGAGVGVSLGVIATAALLWGYYERREKTQVAGAGAGGPTVPVFSDSRAGRGLEVASYPQKFLKRVKSVYGEEQRSY